MLHDKDTRIISEIKDFFYNKWKSNRYNYSNREFFDNTVQELSSREIILTEGALYPALHKLVEENILTVRKATVNNRERKYYSLTTLGEKMALVRLDEIKNSIMVIAKLFRLEPLLIELRHWLQFLSFFRDSVGLQIFRG
jgi:DNA-binding PadR family transcriptional regulator